MRRGPDGYDPFRKKETVVDITPGWSHPDQYYRMTALLSESGARKVTCRFVALVILSLGAIPVALLSSSASPTGRPNHVIAVAIALCCFAMAATWLRGRWPSRAWSVVCVVTGTVGIAATCLITNSPLAGLLGANAFAALSVYTVCFHGMRLLMFTWAVGGVTVGILAARLVGEDTALAMSSVVVVVLVNVFAAFACGLATRVVGPLVDHEGIEPMTGLLNRDAFYQAAAVLLAARSREDDRFFVVVAVKIDNLGAHRDLAGAAATNRARIAIARALRLTVRHNAVLAAVDESEFLVADTFTTADPSALVERIRGAVAATPPGLTSSIGVVSTPLSRLAQYPPDEVIDELRSIADTAALEARAHGGNHYQWVMNPRLKLLEEFDDD